VEQVARTESTVLIHGETGTGKELLARAIHRISDRSARPMVKVNCAALPSTLIESELFGREKGAYTGALTRQVGRFEIADGATIFLDEISELPLELQVKLLRVLQEGQFERLGSSTTTEVDVRVIAATNRDLEKLVEQGAFRDDLFYRLNVFPIHVPPLRERREDIPQLVWSFIEEYSERMGKRIDSIPRRSMETLQHYAWPGNVREIRNTVERAMILCTGNVLRIEPPTTPESKAFQNQTLEEVQRAHILQVLEQTGWKVRGKNGAAEVLGLKPSTLESRMSKLGIKRRK
jgi:transcriptional regulator with GAF, ATPase, and Fis domain